MAHVSTLAQIRTGSFKNPLVALIKTITSMDAAYRQRTALQTQSTCRLSDMGMSNRDVSQEWNPPAMFWT